jgi:ketosteroid isomerase-like protein
MSKARSRKHISDDPSAASLSSENALLWKLEDDWMNDRLLSDATSSDSLIDDEYQGSTSSGRAQTKAEFIKATLSHSGAFTGQTQSERAIKYWGDLAISTGKATLLGPGRAHAFRYLRVFLKKDGGWRLIASQSTPVSIG